MNAIDQLRATLEATRIPGKCELCTVTGYAHAPWCPRGEKVLQERQVAHATPEERAEWIRQGGIIVPNNNQKMPPAPEMYLRWQIKRKRNAHRPWEKHHE